MEIEGVVITVVLMSFIAYKVWKSRRMIKEFYIIGFNMMCAKFGLPPYIPKDKSMKK